ncbi:RteC domain-containing protein [Marinifilum sp. D714]|uniref:RteC domain-containing protein n=1 Tax=Marinifilum sp. D714 TaxID=2937523 RepID=UPI0027CB886C|nr:RteC domain-containing protein [Marinifilum sp. D714]MDQ2178580.1 RteC domain-containing protein [Marinifilum sp. D714]
MIVEENFNCLKNELLKTISELNKELKAGYTYSSPEEYEKFLNGLFFDFIKEVRDNLNQIKEEKQRQTYLESLSKVFAHLNEQVCFGRMLYKEKQSCMNGGASPKEANFEEEQFVILVLKMAQKPIVKDALDFLKGLSNAAKREHYLGNSHPKSWQEERQEFAPVISRIKSELSVITSIRKQMSYLKQERKSLAENYRKEGIDIYNTPLNEFFEARIESLKDAYFILKGEVQAEHGKMDSFDPENGVNLQTPMHEHLQWIATKSDLVELVYGIYHSGAVRKNRISIQDLALALGNLFKVDLNDVYRTFLEIRNRKLVQIKFLDQMKSSLQNKIHELDEKM